MFDVALDVVDLPAGSALVPEPVEVLGDRPELHDQIAGQIFAPDFPSLFTPEANEGRFITAHDDPGIRTSEEGAAISVMAYLLARLHCNLLF